MKISLSGKDVSVRDLLDIRCFCASCVGACEQYLYCTIVFGER